MWLIDLITFVIDYAAPPLLILSPLLSYSDQIYSIYRSKSTAGFSLDIPLVMLVASIFKIYYWFGAYYSYPLLIQACNMVIVQALLLKIALDFRPQAGMKDGIEHVPFNGQTSSPHSGFPRPYNFWQWRSQRPYWTFLMYLSLSLLAIHVFLTPISHSQLYISTLGFAGLGVEAFLPIPQIISNQRTHSCRGFRLSVLISWLLGDAMKMSYFFFSNSSVPWSFRICGVFQCCCDTYLGFQYWRYGDWRPVLREKLPITNGIVNGIDRWVMKESDIPLT